MHLGAATSRPVIPVSARWKGACCTVRRRCDATRLAENPATTRLPVIDEDVHAEEIAFASREQWLPCSSSSSNRAGERLSTMSMLVRFDALGPSLTPDQTASDPVPAGYSAGPKHCWDADSPSTVSPRTQQPLAQRFHSISVMACALSSPSDD